MKIRNIALIIPCGNFLYDTKRLFIILQGSWKRNVIESFLSRLKDYLQISIHLDKLSSSFSVFTNRVFRRSLEIFIDKIKSV